mmetsp:Transcript_27591/g.38815  ORF Transcript_27591/g.38815 Transcript_27591/m.38815 type:complete len:97 (+) Transcript_27591:78-368(+)
MVYISSDGSVAEKRTLWRFSIITDLFKGIWSIFALFFTSFTEKPERRVENNYRLRTRSGVGSSSSSGGSTEQKRRKGSNIRGVRDLGDAKACAGGG